MELVKTHSETRLDFSKYDAHKKQRTFLCFTLFFMILRRNHVSQVPPKRRISVLIYAKMPPFFHAERTHGWIKKKATLQHAESLKIYPMPSIFFCSSQSGGRPLRNVLSVISFGKVPIIAMWMISGESRAS